MARTSQTIVNDEAGERLTQEASMVPETPAIPEIRVRGVTPEQLTLYRESLEETCGFIAHPDFAKPRADLRFFGDCLADRERGSREFDWLQDSEPSKACLGDDRPTAAPLTARQEQNLFYKLNFLRYKIANRLKNISDTHRPPAAEVRRVAALRRLVRRVRDRLVEANMPLVISMAKRARINNVEFPELISEGNMALLRAVDKFDASRGFKLSTYACRAMLKGFARLAVRQSRHRLHFPTEYDPSLENGEWTEVARGLDEAAALSDLRHVLSDNLPGLDEIERTIIRERFALNAARRPDAGQEAEAKPKTLQEVGEIVGLTKERVRQIQNNALRKLRRMLDSGVRAA